MRSSRISSACGAGEDAPARPPRPAGPAPRRSWPAGCAPRGRSRARRPAGSRRSRRGQLLGLGEVAGRDADVHQRAADLADDVGVAATEGQGALGVAAGRDEVARVEVHLGPDRGVAGQLEVARGAVERRRVLLGPLEEPQALVGAAHLGGADAGPAGELRADDRAGRRHWPARRPSCRGRRGPASRRTATGRPGWRWRSRAAGWPRTAQAWRTAESTRASWARNGSSADPALTACGTTRSAQVSSPASACSRVVGLPREEPSRPRRIGGSRSNRPSGCDLHAGCAGRGPRRAGPPGVDPRRTRRRARRGRPGGR